MNKRDWISFGIAILFLAIIQLLLGVFNIEGFIIACVLVLAINQLFSIFRK